MRVYNYFHEISLTGENDMNQVLNKREDIEDKFKWDMTDVYKDEDLWEQDRVKAYENIGEI